MAIIVVLTLHVDVLNGIIKPCVVHLKKAMVHYSIVIVTDLIVVVVVLIVHHAYLALGLLGIMNAIL